MVRNVSRATINEEILLAILNVWKQVRVLGRMRDHIRLLAEQWTRSCAEFNFYFIFTKRFFDFSLYM